MDNKIRRHVLVMALVLAVLMLFTACDPKARQVKEQLDLGQKYLTESDYSEAILAFTAAIEIDPENIPAYMGRAQAYRGTGQYEEAKADYTTVIEKTEGQPYTQAEAYVGRAEVGEIIEDQQSALDDYQSAANTLDKVDLEKITDVTEQMLEAMKIKVYNAIARLSALFGQHEAAVAAYTSALDSLNLLPDDAEVMDVPEAKVTSYAGRVQSNLELENYDAVLPDYDALIELGEDKTQERDTLLAALSWSHSQKADLGSSDSWLKEVSHGDYASSIQMDTMVKTLAQAAALAQTKGTDAYDDIRTLLTSAESQTAMRNLLGRGYQLRYYDTESQKMLAVYAGDTAWADVKEENSGVLTADTLETLAAVPTGEQLNQVAISPLYVYYGSHEGRSREGEGLWYILNPGSWEDKARSYEWENDRPVDGFEVDCVQITNVEFDRNAYLNGGPTAAGYAITVEYDCPSDDTYELIVGYYDSPTSYSSTRNSTTTVSGSGTYRCSLQIYTGISFELEGTNFGFVATLVNMKDIEQVDENSRRFTPTDKDNLYINAAGNLTRNQTGQ